MGRLAWLFVLIAVAALPAIVSADGAAPAGTMSATSASASLAMPAGATTTPDGWFAPPANLKRPKLPDEVSRAFVIPIREEITEKTFDALQRKIERCRKGGAQLIILDMDTWGGMVLPALDISRALKVDLADVYTVCYVRTRAVSAGALIALACNEVVMVPAGSFGDCAPIAPGTQITGVEREKIESELRREFRESAARSGYSEALAQAMVSWDLEVWLIRNKTTRQLQYAVADEWRTRVDMAPGDARPGTAQPAVEDKSGVTRPRVGTVSPRTSAAVISNPAAEWEFVRMIKPAGRLLDMKTDEAVAYGFVKTVVTPSLSDPYGALMKHFNVIPQPVVLEDTWSELLVEFLTSAAVAGILFGLGVFLAYMELNAPGHFVPGILAAICFAIFFGSRYLVGLADWWQIALFMIGLVLIIVELLTFHTVGLLLVVGAGCCILALLGVLVPHMPGTLPVPQNDMDWSIFQHGALALGLGFIAAVVAAMLFARFLPRLPIAGKLILQPVMVPSEPPVSSGGAITEIAVGDIGLAESLCRPVGKVRFGDRLLNATSSGEIIQPGDRVKVLKRDENRIIVEKA